MSRQPVRVESRTFGDILLGILSVIALLGLAGGVPYALIRFYGNPLPTSFSLEALTRQVGFSTVMDMLVILVWLAWGQLVVCIFVELWSGVRRVGVPSQVPFARGPQALAHRLVTAALLLFTAAAVVAPIATAVSSAAGPASSASQMASAEQAQAGAHDEVEQLTTVKKVKKVYSVQPPEGRHHESLWEIAEKCLGEGRRYKEIYELNKHKVQPDGTKLHIASLIRPGWVLEMPDDARNVHIVDADQSRKETLDQHPDKPAELGGKQAHVQADMESMPSMVESQVDPEQTMNVREYVQPQSQVQAAQDEGWDLSALPDYVAAASLAAAGLLAALGRRRREQLWNRAFGRRVPLPSGPGALAEKAMLLGADVQGTRLLDLGLRHLNKELGQQGRTPPTVYGAFLASTHLDLWIHPGDKEAPAPWTAVDGGQVWRLDATEGLRMSEHAVSGVLAPYPGLVSIGANDGGRVLVDLEAAHGIVNLRGPAPYTTAALAAVAVELATNRWSDHMNLVLVGFGAELALIAPERIKVAGSLAEALPALEARTAEVQQALAAVGADSVLTGRARGSYGEAWMPTYLLSAVAPTPEEGQRLAELAKTGARLASGYLIAGEATPGAVWQWEVDAHGQAALPALGFNVKAQLLPDDQYRQVIDLFRTASSHDGLPLNDPEPSGPAAHQLHAGFRPLVDIRVLGAVEVLAPHPLEQDRLAQCQELVAYVATHPGGVHPRVLAGALWPRGVEESVRDAVIDRAMDWLGDDSNGRPNLYLDLEGRLHLGPEVRVDWEIFKELGRLARHDRVNEMAMLDHALNLVRGPLLADRPQGRYLWLAGDQAESEVMARVSDAAHRLWELRFGAGDAEGAITAVLAGLRVSEGDEALWRDLLRAAHATGDMNTLQFWVSTLRQRAANAQYWGRLVPETEALIEELLPSAVPAQAV
ncbi:BTAD domain-containing putative transcriptional regulator [Nonomuraea sp. NPDC050556]|uniref:BTAD domain-containing putative transcriptional regulator n=1 Tax=Nonomuraea sp. NPDC050556 TaxID=3364369 RepID=UPI0037AB2CC3